MSPNYLSNLQDLLDPLVDKYNQPDFIAPDPIGIPHRFSKLQDIEIAGFFTAVLAWGRRSVIINKCTALLEAMDNSPYEFILHHQPHDLKKLEGFCHRTFNDTDLLYFVDFLKRHYQEHFSLETAFYRHIDPKQPHLEQALSGFHDYFFEIDYAPQRARKHVATPARGSACKRLCMYLRWMVRQDNKGVDFGLWRTLSPSLLVCPCDVHVERVARRLGLITESKGGWKMALELTNVLRQLDPNDPVKYDFALFGLGVSEKP